MTSINLAEKLATFEGHWQPRVIGQFNGHEEAHVLLIERAGTPNTGDATTAAPRRSI